MLSVCIITKNEKENLERCLQQLSGYGFELVVVDTGSTDGTLQMARQYTESVYEFAWCNDFAKAKNYAVSKAQHDMVLVMDSDEYLRSIDLEALTEQMQQFPRAVGRIKRINQMYHGNEIRESKEYINRLFNRRYYHYEGKIHEQLTANAALADGRTYPTYVTSIAADHSGYLLSEEARNEKAKRNIRLLEQALADDGEDPYLLYQLGKSYYLMQDNWRACEYFARALSFDLNPKLEYVIDMVDCYGYALLNTGQEEAALSFEGIYGEFGHRADFQFLMGLVYMRNSQFELAVREFMKAAKQDDCQVSGVNSYLAYYNTGVIYECLGEKGKALEMYGKCGDYEPAKRQIAVLKNC